MHTFIHTHTYTRSDAGPSPSHNRHDVLASAVGCVCACFICTHSVAMAPDLQLKILELQDQVAEMQAALADKEDKLASRAQELLGLSASLLEKEQMLKSAGLGEANDVAVTRASHNVMMEELEEVKNFKCKASCGGRTEVITCSGNTTH